MLKKIKFIALALTLISFEVEAKPIEHVIYVTLDGVRWQDIVSTKNHFPILWKQYASSMTVYGEPGSQRTMETASVPISLPSYQSQMTGAIQPCDENDCGQVLVKTLPENILSSLKLDKTQVAVFSSWDVIGHALESKKNTVYSSVGNSAAIDPITGEPDETMAKINHLQTLKHHRYHNNRMDEYTFKQSMHYFEKYKPVFLWISLVNADNEAHDNYLKQYHAILNSYDNYLDQLFKTLKQMKLDKNTLVIITTDHGRGDGQNWINHGPELPESKRSWAFVMNGQLESGAYGEHTANFSTLSMRPTIEKALGIV